MLTNRILSVLYGNEAGSLTMGQEIDFGIIKLRILQTKCSVRENYEILRRCKNIELVDLYEE